MKIPSPTFDGWNTPRALLDVIESFKPIALDPCSNEHSLVNSRVKLTREQDGLGQDWGSYTKRCELVFVNPPFDCETLQRVSEKAYETAQFQGIDTILLAPVKADQEWYQNAIVEASALCFIKGRVPFLREGKRGQGSQFACAFFYYGTDIDLFCVSFASVGRVVKVSAL